ncbi:MAG: DUF257 family protein [Thermococcus sp.]|uniref:Uncharacterized protein n=2 Tax=Thermococcus guaymasensis TaxID=110164 RepID=A0A0X1KLL5_9EURY|nr:hypothetical protein X802_08220 [Thermococcus guaymasensis DSM 11113]MCD6523804.1 DUF257 family protein [Thermococcus sp.]
MLKYEETSRLTHSFQPGDRVLMEYEAKLPISKIAWRYITRYILEDEPVIIFDFYGIGDIMFRNYLRLISGEEYRQLIESKRNIYIFKIGPGGASYGEVVGHEKVYTDAESFLKGYYTMVQRALSLPRKPRYAVVFGISEYLYFAGPSGLFNIINVISTIPIEDWVTIILLNVDAVNEKQRSILEEISSWVVRLVEEGCEIVKGGNGRDD